MTLILLDVPLPGPRTTVTTAEAHGNAARIFTIEPSCAGPGDTVTITGNGFGALNMEVYVGGQETGHGIITGGLRAQLVSAYGNRATFIVPQEAPGGVSIVWAVNPGSHAGFIAFRVRQSEICGNQVDEDCDGQLDDVDICVPVNRPPVAEAGFGQTASVGTTIHLDGSASNDPDGDPLGYQWTLIAIPPGSTATLTDATTIAPSFTIDQAGSYTVQLLVTDGSLSSQPDTVTISTTNSAPIADAGPDQTGRVETTFMLDGRGSTDIDGDPLTYQWTVLNRPAGSGALLIDPASVNPTFTPDVFGEYVVQLVVHDGTVASASDTMTISTLNSPPTADAGPDQSVLVTETVALDGSGSGDIDGNALTYQWSLVSKPAGSTAGLQNPTTVTPSFVVDTPGEYVVQLVVNDGIASSAPDTVLISTRNSRPVAHAGNDQSSPVGTAVTLDGTASSDVDGDALSYEWSLLSKPAASTALLQQPTTGNPSFTIDKPGEYIGQLIVSDGTIESIPDTVTISTVNSRPLAQAGADQSHPVGTTVTLDGTGSSDVDGDPLQYVWALTAKPSGSTASLSDPSAPQPTVVIDQPGTYTAQLLVHDGTVESEPDTVTLSTVNSKPVADAGPAQHGVVGTTITLDGTGSADVDGDALTYQWSLTTKPATSTASLQNATTAHPTFVLDKAGTYVVQLLVHDGTVDSAPATVTITTLNSRPVADAGPDQTVTAGTVVTLDGNGSGDADEDALAYDWALTVLPAGSAATLTDATTAQPSFVADAEGLYVAQLIVHDGHLASAPDTVTVTVPDAMPPPPANLGNITLSPVSGGHVTLTGSANSVEGGARVIVTNGRTNQSVSVTANADGSFTLQIGAQTGDTLSIIVTDSAGNSSVPGTLQVEPPLPPDPATVAPPVDRTIATTVFDATAFLYTGSNPIQTGVTAGTIEPRRAAVIRGKVFKRDNSPLSGVTITVLNHPELGQTLSRADGLFDMAVNGGGVLTFNYAKAGYLPAQRQIEAPWQDYAFLPDVVLIQPDPVVTTIDLTNTTQPMQVAAGSVVTDADGTRQAVVMIPQGTTATLVMPDGSTQPLTSLNVRLTEYTVGANGPEAMPGVLPPTSAYTYAFELSADEAIAAGATEVRLSQPVPVYVDNFLNFAAGGIVPVGAYDRQQAAWVPEANGKVVQVLAINNGVAELDTNGDNVADDAATLAAVGISGAEQQQLAQRYTAGRNLWRVSLPYFARWDCNWPAGPPADAITPNGPALDSLSDNLPLLDSADRSATGGAGAEVAVQNQTLGQQADLVGTPFTLHYQSNRSRGQVSAYTLTIPVSGATVPASVHRIDVTTRVAGRKFSQSFAPQPNLTTTFTWDGRDAYGRFLNGRQPIETFIEFVYPGIYQEPATLERVFGQATGFPKPQSAGSRADVVFGIRWSGLIGGWDAREQGLGGWTLAPHHGYDPIGQTFYLGDGTQVSGSDGSSDNLGNRVTPFAGSASSILGDGGPATAARLDGPGGLVVGPDGSVYFTDGGQRVRRVRPDGIITTVAGGAGGSLVDGASATAGPLCSAINVALGPDESLYIVESGLGCHRVRRVRNGIITTVTGTGVQGFSGDGGPAPAAVLNTPKGVAVGADGSVYIADSGNRRVRKVSPDGLMTTIVGGGTNFTADGIPATQADLGPFDVTLGADGSLYILAADGRIRRVSPGGIITTAAGSRNGAVPTHGMLATQAAFSLIGNLTVTSDLSLVISDGGRGNVWQVTPEKILIRVAGNGTRGVSGDGGPATAASFWAPRGIGFDQEGSLYIADPANSTTTDRVRRVRSTLPGFAGLTDLVLASKDGSEAYVFNSRGRHVRTVNTLTNSLIYQFGYDSTGKLITVTDANTNVTTITRDATGKVTGITGPYGQNNSITLDANGYLASITNPNGETTSFSYTPEGLLTSTTPPGKPASSFQYDSNGRLLQTSDPAGGSETLTRSAIPNGYQVSSVTGGGQASTYKVEYLPDGQQRRTNTMPDGTVETTQIRTDGSQQVTQADGITQTVGLTGDPRFGLQSPLPTSLAVTTPGGKNGTLTNARTVNLSDPNNPLTLSSQTDTVTFNGRTATRTYNASTRTATDTSPAGRIRTTVTDPQGRVTQQQQGALAPTAFSYDARGRLASHSQGGRSTSLTYGTLGRPQTITDSASRTVQFQYDSAGRVTSQTLPDGRVITYTYDGSGNVTSITPPGKPAHGFTYTAVNLEKDYLAPAISGGGTNTTTYTYNADKQVTGITRPDGQQITLGYAGGKLANQTFPTGAIAYGYNPQGNLSSASFSGGGTVNYIYDGSLLLSSTWSGPVAGNVTWTYDNNYRKTSQSVNGGNTVNFAYDNDDLLTGAGSMTLTRDAQNGLLSGTTLGTVTESMTYNSLGEVATSTSSISGSAILSETYTRDSLGRISQKSETIQGVITTYGYTYDTAGRLTEVKHNGVTVSVYAYDANSNRQSKTSPTGTQTGTYDDQDRLLTYNGTTYSYTANGELASKTVGSQVTSYSYDALGNLRSVTLPSGTQLGYVIDGENRRIGKTVNGSLVQGFLYENQLEPVAELDGSGTLVSRFVYGNCGSSGCSSGGCSNSGCGHGNVPLYMVKSGVTYRILSDHLGSPRLVIDSTTGVIVQRMDYDEFGNVILDTNPGFQPFGFAGGIYDRDTGLVRHGARDYDPETGRWTAKDPIKFAGRSANLYGYVFNDPINTVDLDGKIAITLPGTVATVALGQALLFVGSALLFAFAIFKTFDKEGPCYQKYLDDTAWCGEAFTDDMLYNMCMDWAWRQYIRCLNGLKREPFRGGIIR